MALNSNEFYHFSRNGASRTAQCREISHSFPEQVLQARVGDLTTHPPPSPPAVSARNWTSTTNP